MKTLLIKIFRWIVRVISGLIIVFFLLMFIGETFFGENPGNPMTTSAIIQLSLTGVGLIGLGLAWRWELIGGIIALVPFLLVAIINPLILLPSPVYIWPFTAVLFIVLWAISRKTTVKNK